MALKAYPTGALTPATNLKHVKNKCIPRAIQQESLSASQALMKIVYPGRSASETPKHCELVPLC